MKIYKNESQITCQLLDNSGGSYEKRRTLNDISSDL